MARLTQLMLRDFRNYADLSLSLDGRHVCLFGENGAGKTNLIEAISQLSPGRGLRSTPIGDLARTGARQWTVAASLDQDGVDRRLGVGLERSEAGNARRIVKLDGEDATHSTFAELVRVVWLTPAMDRVFAGGATDRRKFLDRQVMAHFPSHGRASATYERAMRERNMLLDQPGFDPSWMDALEARLAEAGAEIADLRARVVLRLRDAIAERPEGAFPKADITLEGALEAAALEGKARPALRDLLADLLRNGRRRDMAAGRTLSGPHRSDLVVIHAPSGQPAGLCSTGQQKALLIGLILANARALQSAPDQPNPLILLDEAAAHLDPERRAALFDELSALDGQSWLTGTEAMLFEAFGDRAQKVEVRQGLARVVDAASS